MTEQPHHGSPGEPEPRPDQPRPGQQPAPRPEHRAGHAEVAATAPPREAPPREPDTEQRGLAWPGMMRRISWGAIIAGVVIVLILQMTLGVLGVGVGALAAGPGMAEELAIGGMIWWIVSALIALFAGGWAAGYLAGVRERLDGVLHGVVTWGLATILGVFLLATAMGQFAAGTLQIMQTGVAAVEAAPDEAQQQQMQQLMEQADDEQLQQQFEQLMQQAQAQMPTAEEAQAAVAQAGIWTFVGLILGGLAAAVGGLVGAPQDAPRTHLPRP